MISERKKKNYWPLVLLKSNQCAYFVFKAPQAFSINKYLSQEKRGISIIKLLFFIGFTVIASCNSKKEGVHNPVLFQQLKPSQTGINFSNDLDYNSNLKLPLLR